MSKGKEVCLHAIQMYKTQIVLIDSLQTFMQKLHEMHGELLREKEEIKLNCNIFPVSLRGRDQTLHTTSPLNQITNISIKTL